MKSKKFTKIICTAAVAAALTLSGCSGLTGMESTDENKSTGEKSVAVTQTSHTEAAPKTINQPESNAKISDARNTPAPAIFSTGLLRPKA